jgi:DNA-binding transcriptional LysR family regulator
MRPNLSIQKLRAFVEVVERHSITDASRFLGVSQPVVSVHIRDVHHYFGTDLLYQDGRRMVPTEAGELVYKHVKEILSALQGAQDSVRLLDSGHAGTASIGASETPGSYRLPDRLISFHLEHPKAQLSLAIGVASEIWEQTRNGVFDFSVVAGPAPPRDLQVATYSEEPLVLVCSPDHPLAEQVVHRSDLRGQDLVTASRRSVTDDRLHAFGLENSTAVIKMGSTEGIKRAVQQGIGVAVLFRCSVEQEFAAGTLTEIRVDGVNEQRPFYLIADPRKRLSPFQRRLFDFLLKAPGTELEPDLKSLLAMPDVSHLVSDEGGSD